MPPCGCSHHAAMRSNLTPSCAQSPRASGIDAAGCVPRHAHAGARGLHLFVRVRCAVISASYTSYTSGATWAIVVLAADAPALAGIDVLAQFGGISVPGVPGRAATWCATRS